MGPGVALIFGMLAVFAAAFLAWTYTKPGKRWLKNL